MHRARREIGRMVGRMNGFNKRLARVSAPLPPFLSYFRSLRWDHIFPRHGLIGTLKGNNQQVIGVFKYLLDTIANDDDSGALKTLLAGPALFISLIYLRPSRLPICFRILYGFRRAHSIAYEAPLRAYLYNTTLELAMASKGPRVVVIGAGTYLLRDNR